MEIHLPQTQENLQRCKYDQLYNHSIVQQVLCVHAESKVNGESYRVQTIRIYLEMQVQVLNGLQRHETLEVT